MDIHVVLLSGHSSARDKAALDRPQLTLLVFHCGRQVSDSFAVADRVDSGHFSVFVLLRVYSSSWNSGSKH